MGIIFVVLSLWCLALCVIDVRSRRLPDWLTLPGAAIINGSALIVEPMWALGGLAWAGVYFVTAVLVGGIGGGDIKFALGLGTAVASLGLGPLMGAIVGSSAMSVLLGGIFVVANRGYQPHYIPHGPSMVVASTCMFLVFKILGEGWIR
ncbi:signal peptidase [Corynebacterium deserti GIMN1.010]|uniref:Signal peptidase n=1 Tax=Corynebacterium deserti GIMN1.010 TaxID=931089 RepID=A0A0M4CJP1_9CORY|nr:A24 family peptidase [Corynebacterium deserti]ALC06026.1 signal peptidase [Corynebacterium deserti GIMN1.010]